MNEQRIIAALKKKDTIKTGSKPSEMTPYQQRLANVIGKLLVHAHKRGKRKNNKWINETNTKATAEVNGGSCKA